MVAAESRYAAWMRNGRASFLAWLLVLGVYVGFRFASIEDPVVTNALIGFTGLLVGNLGIAQGQKQARTEQRAKVNAERLDDLETGAAASKTRADESERREVEWSQHLNHKQDKRGDDTDAE